MVTKQFNIVLNICINNFITYIFRQLRSNLTMNAEEGCFVNSLACTAAAYFPRQQPC